jgi:hypothetical protein
MPERTKKKEKTEKNYIMKCLPILKRKFKATFSHLLIVNFPHKSDWVKEDDYQNLANYFPFSA